MDQFCFEVKPGEGRLAKCIVEQLAEQEKPGYAETKISETCKATLDKFVVDRAGGSLSLLLQIFIPHIPSSASVWHGDLR